MGTSQLKFTNFVFLNWNIFVNLLVTGGYPDSCVSSITYILRRNNSDGSFKWINGTSLPTSRGGLMCSTVWTGWSGNETQKVIVAGGRRGQTNYDIVEIYNVDENMWEIGNS